MARSFSKINQLVRACETFERMSIKKIAQSVDYLTWADAEIDKLKSTFPSVSLKSFNQFKDFLDTILPKLIHKYILLSGAVKVCSTISPDFAEIATARGFPVLVHYTSGHVRNVVLTLDGPYIVDLTYIQFLCGAESNGSKEDRKKALEMYRQIYTDPFKAVKIEKLPISAMPNVVGPTGNYSDHLYNPVESIDLYDMEETEEAFPERFDRLKRNQ